MGKGERDFISNNMRNEKTINDLGLIYENKNDYEDEYQSENGWSLPETSARDLINFLNKLDETDIENISIDLADFLPRRTPMSEILYFLKKYPKKSIKIINRYLKNNDLR